jgi:hypothetical protein
MGVGLSTGPSDKFAKRINKGADMVRVINVELEVDVEVDVEVLTPEASC